MPSSARESYLTTQVLTASPQKLQLLLVEAAIRSAQRAKQQWQAGGDQQACEALIHAQDVIGELLARLDREAQPELARKMSAVYMHIFRTLMEANLQHDAKKIDDALRVLEIERETWRQACSVLGSTQETDGQIGHDLRSDPPHAPSPPSFPDHSPVPHDGGDLSSAGFSLEA